MRLFDLVAILIVLAAIFSYMNVRWLRLPATIGLMVLSLAFSVGVVVLGFLVPSLGQQAQAIVQQFEFGEALLHGMLGFLLFAGALHVDIGDLNDHKWPIAIMATFGVVISIVIVATLFWGVFAALGNPLRPIDCLLFGALISPTDPISVLALVKQAGAPKQLEVQIAGESLFNDGVGVVVFAGLLEVAEGGAALDAAHLATLLRVRQPAGRSWDWRLGYSCIGCSSPSTTTRLRFSSRLPWWRGAMRLQRHCTSRDRLPWSLPVS